MTKEARSLIDSGQTRLQQIGQGASSGSALVSMTQTGGCDMEPGFRRFPPETGAELASVSVTETRL